MPNYTVTNPLRTVKGIQWVGITEADPTGSAAMAAHFNDKTVAVSGTFGSGGNLTFEGSNDGTNWFPMTDPQGNPLTFTSGRLEMLQENPLYIRPVLSAGTGVSLDVIVIGVG